MSNLHIALDAQHAVIDIQEGSGLNEHYKPVADWYEPKQGDYVKLDPTDTFYIPDPMPVDDKYYERTSSGTWAERQPNDQEKLKTAQKEREAKREEAITEFFKVRKTQASGEELTAITAFETEETNVNTLEEKIERESRQSQSSGGE